MRKRRVKSVMPTQDKAWHDAEMAKGFWDYNNKQYVPWGDFGYSMAMMYIAYPFDNKSIKMKRLHWSMDDPDYKPIEPGSGRYKRRRTP